MHVRSTSVAKSGLDALVYRLQRRWTAHRKSPFDALNWRGLDSSSPSKSENKLGAGGIRGLEKCLRVSEMFTGQDFAACAALPKRASLPRTPEADSEPSS